MPATAVSGVYIAHLHAPDNGDAQPHHLRRARRREHLRRRLPDLRHDLAGLQHLRRLELLPGRRQRARLQGQLQPAGRAPAAATERPRLLLRQRVPDGPLHGAQRLRRQLHRRRRHRSSRRAARRTTRSSCRSATTSTGAGRSGPTSRPRATPGVNLQFLSGNEVYWRTRYEPSIDGSHTAYRTLVSYKETWANAKIDPSPEWTGTWRDPRFAPTSQGGGMPENALTGTQYMVNFSDLPITVERRRGQVPAVAQHLASPAWPPGQTPRSRRTRSATSPTRTSTTGIDRRDWSGCRPRPAHVPEYLQDFGNTVAPGTTTHHLTLYQAPSGALVFSAGTVQWTWGLDDDARHRVRRRAGRPADAAGPGQPARRHGRAADDADDRPRRRDEVHGHHRPRRVTITSPAAGANRSPTARRSPSTGTATDTGGGRVAGVEVSTDGGATWHPADRHHLVDATPTSSAASAVTPIRVRAIDDSANIGAAVDPRSSPSTCPCTIFGDEVPPIAAANDPSASSSACASSPPADGFITGVRFYKGTGNTGTHVGSLWSTAGAAPRDRSPSPTRRPPAGSRRPSPRRSRSGRPDLRRRPTPRPTATTPCRATPSTAVRVRRGAAAGRRRFRATPAGVYANPGQFPTSAYQNTNYYVDVMFTTTDDSPLIATDQLAAARLRRACRSARRSARRYSKPVTAGSAGARAQGRQRRDGRRHARRTTPRRGR